MRRFCYKIQVIGTFFVFLLTFVYAQENFPLVPKPDFSNVEALEVVRVVDGDTIIVQEMVDQIVIDGKVIQRGKGDQITVRLIGVDTPETVHPQKMVEAFGKEASAFTTNLLKGEKVYLLFEQGPSKTDKYGRTLAYVYRFPDGLFVNLEIVRQGYGHAYTSFPFEYMETFRFYERRAREIDKGLWVVDTEKVTESAPERYIAPTPIPVSPKMEQPKSSVSEQETVTVYITRTGAKYHRAGCRYLSKSMIPISLKDAKQRYSPCSVCSPP